MGKVGINEKNFLTKLDRKYTLLYVGYLSNKNTKKFTPTGDIKMQTKKFLILINLFLLIIFPAHGEVFSPTRLELSAPEFISYAFDGSEIKIPVTVSGTPASVVFLVFTQGQGSSINNIRNGHLGWHYVNKIDTCVYVSTDYNFTPGNHVITWDGRDADGNIVEPGDYTYYMWAYDNVNTCSKEPAAPLRARLPWQDASTFKTHNADGIPLDNPILFSSELEKWIIGTDPSDIDAVETCHIGYSADAPLIPDPYSDDMFFIMTVDNSLTAHLIKYSWVPNGAGELQTGWGVDGEVTWNINTKTPLSNAIYAGNDVIIGANTDTSGVSSESELVLIDAIEGYEIRRIDLSEWWIRVQDGDAGGQQSSGPNDFDVRHGLLFMGSHTTCLNQVINPFDEDWNRWVNQNGDYVGDKNFEETSERPWVCHDYSVGPYKYRFTADDNLFSIFPANDVGSVSFGLYAPDGTGIGYYSYAGEENGASWASLFLDYGSAYDGIYTDNNKLFSKWHFIGHDSIKGAIVSLYSSTNLIAPNGGEIWEAGIEYDIVWQSSVIEKFNIEYSIDGGSNWNIIAESVDAASGPYKWTTPQIVSFDCLIKITDSSNPYHFYISAETFTIEGYGSIAGIITDEKTGAGIEGAAVTVTPGDYTVVTDSDGVYTIPEIFIGDGYTVTAAAVDYLENSVTEVSVIKGDTTTVDIALTPKGSINGTITDLQTGSGIAGATVTVTPGNYTSETNQNGEYTINDIPAGDGYTVIAASLIHLSNSAAEVSVTTGGTTTVDIALTPKGTINGTITDLQTGSGIAGANVTVSPGNYTSETNQNGEYTINDIPAGDGYTVTAASLIYLSNSIAEISVTTGDITTVDMTLTPKGAIIGTITDLQTGAGIAGASVTAEPGEYSVITESNGEYTITDIISGEYTVTITAADYFEKEETGVSVITGVIKTVDIALTPKGSIDGTITDLQTGSVIADAAITVSPGNYTSETNQNGEYTINDIPAGNNYTVTAAAVDYLENSVTEVSVIKGDTTTVDIALTPKGTINGAITDLQTGSVIADAAVTVSPGNYTSETNQNGEYIINDIPAGDGYTVTVASLIYLSNSAAEVSVTTGDTTTVDITLTPKGTIIGAITDLQTGSGIAGATVTAAPGEYSVMTESNGDYTITDVISGEYTVTAAAAGYFERVEAGVSVITGGTTTVDMTLLENEGWMANITAVEEENSIEIQFGAHPHATEGIDAELGESMLPPVAPTGNYDVRFSGAELGNGTLRDIRPDNLTSLEFVINIQRSQYGIVTLRWDSLSDIQGKFLLQDVFTGEVINVDMKSTNEYVIDNTAIIQVKIVFENNEGTWVINHENGWHMVSPGVDVQDNSVTSVFPEAISAFEYDNGYNQVDSLFTGRGYWINLGDSCSNTAVGGVIDSLTLNLSEGWHMTGTVSGNVPFQYIDQNPPDNIITIYRFKSSYERVTEQLRQGEGYWVNMQNPGSITLRSTGGPWKVSARDMIAEKIQNSSFEVPITIDMGNMSKTISIFVSEPEKSYDDINRYFEMPPLPPSGIFDVRIAWGGTNGLSSIVIGEDKTIEASIDVTAPEGDKSGIVRWDMQGFETGRFLLGNGGTTVDMALEGELEIEGSTQRLTFIYKGMASARGEITSYRLMDNYPNPFNPETTITYTIKDAGRVELIIYNMLGREVKRLVDSTQQPGIYNVSWDGKGDDGNEVSAGLYLYRIKANDFVKTKKMLFLR